MVKRSIKVSHRDILRREFLSDEEVSEFISKSVEKCLANISSKAKRLNGVVIWEALETQINSEWVEYPTFTGSDNAPEFIGWTVKVSVLVSVEE